MMTAKFKNKKILFLFFTICLIFLGFIANLRILADSNKKNFTEYIRERLQIPAGESTDDYYIGPIDYNTIERPNKKAVLNEHFIQVINSQFPLFERQKTDADYRYHIKIFDKENKIELTFTPYARQFFDEVKILILKYDHNLQNLKTVDKEGTIKLTEEQFKKVKDNQNYDDVFQALEPKNHAINVIKPAIECNLVDQNNEKKIIMKSKKLVFLEGSNPEDVFEGTKELKLSIISTPTPASDTNTDKNTEDDKGISWFVWAIIIVFVTIIGIISFRIFKNRK